MKIITSKSGKTITLRPVQLGDVDALYNYALELEKEDTFITLNPNEPIDYPDEVAFVTSQVAKIARKEIVSFLAMDGKKVVGTVIVTKQGKRHTHVGLLGISLRQAYRGDGLGKQMVEAATEIAKAELGTTKMILTCFAVNDPALGLYRKMGFEEYGRLPGAYQYKGDLVDQILMHKDLELPHA